MGSLRARGVDDERVASVEHAFRPPSSADGGGGAPAAPVDSAAPATQRRKRGEIDVVGPPPSGAQRVGDVGDIVGIEDNDLATTSPGGTRVGGEEERLGLLGMMASALKENDPLESASVEGLARKLSGREYFLDPRVFNHRQVRHML